MSDIKAFSGEDAQRDTRYPLRAAVRLLTFPDGERLMFRTATARVLAGNDPQAIGLPMGSWTHRWSPIVLYKSAHGRFVKRQRYSYKDDRFEALDLEQAAHLFSSLTFKAVDMDEAFDSQFDDA